MMHTLSARPRVSEMREVTDFCDCTPLKCHRRSVNVRHPQALLISVFFGGFSVLSKGEDIALGHCSWFCTQVKVINSHLKHDDPQALYRKQLLIKSWSLQQMDAKADTNSMDQLRRPSAIKSKGVMNRVYDEEIYNQEIYNQEIYNLCSQHHLAERKPSRPTVRNPTGAIRHVAHTRTKQAQKAAR
jgi:hypothetical protein